jgi:hypothetical protein
MSSELRPKTFFVSIFLGSILATAGWSLLGGGPPAHSESQAGQKKEGWEVLNRPLV